MRTSRVVIAGEVRGKPRPRFNYRGGHAGAYTPTDYARYERMIASEYVRQGGELHRGPIAIKVDIERALPRSRPKRVTSEPDTYKPDADNLGKAVLDALNGVAYEDDRKVVWLEVRKHPRKRMDADIMTIEVTEVVE